MQFQPNPVSLYRPASRCAFTISDQTCIPLPPMPADGSFTISDLTCIPLPLMPADDRFAISDQTCIPLPPLPADDRFIIMGKTVLRSSVCRQEGCLPYRRGQPVLSLHMRRLKRMWRLESTSHNNMSRMRRLIFGNAAQPYLVPVEPKPPRLLDLRASTSINSISGCFFFMRN